MMMVYNNGADNLQEQNDMVTAKVYSGTLQSIIVHHINLE